MHRYPNNYPFDACNQLRMPSGVEIKKPDVVEWHLNPRWTNMVQKGGVDLTIHCQSACMLSFRKRVDVYLYGGRHFLTYRQP